MLHRTASITVNGVALHEQSYLFPGAAPSPDALQHHRPPGRLWVMGDNRSVSYDSRGHMQDPGGGTIPESKVVGRAFMIVWPPSRWRILPIPATFGQPGVDQRPRCRGGHSGAGPVAEAAGLPMVTQPSAPYLPLEAGFAAALPLTWVQRRVRLRARRRRRGRPGERHGVRHNGGILATPHGGPRG